MTLYKFGYFSNLIISPFKSSDWHASLEYFNLVSHADNLSNPKIEDLPVEKDEGGGFQIADFDILVCILDSKILTFLINLVVVSEFTIDNNKNGGLIELAYNFL